MSVYETSITNPKKQLEFYKDLSEQLEKQNKELKEKLEQCSAVADTNSELADSIDEHYKKQQKEFIEWLEEKKNELYKKLSDYNDLARIGKETDIEFFEPLILERRIDVYEEILSKIEKR